MRFSYIHINHNTPNSVTKEVNCYMQMTNNTVKYEVFVKQYLRAILYLSGITNSQIFKYPKRSHEKP